MKSNRIALVLTVAALVGLGISVAPASAAGSATGPPPAPRAVSQPSRYADYLPATGPAVAASGGDQCGMTVSARTGNWICFDAQQPSAVQPKLAAASVTSYCISAGCYYEDYNLEVEFISNYFTFGISSMILGTGSMYVDWYLVNSSYSFAQSADFTVSHSTSKAVFSGALSNGARGVANGGAVIKSCTARSSGAHGANVTIYSPTPYCVLSDNGNYDHNMVSQMSWYISGEPGYWYVFERSVVAHSPQRGSLAFYTFDPVNYLPGNPSGNGYHS